MSSSTYSTELRPDTALRRLVLLSGVLLGVAGGILIVTLTLPVWLRCVAVAGWFVLTAYELATVSRAYTEYGRLRTDACGEFQVRDRSGAWHAAELLPGSLMLRRAGWIRLATGTGHRFAEPIRGNCRENEDWRRLQVIWRHVGALRRSC